MRSTVCFLSVLFLRCEAGLSCFLPSCSTARASCGWREPGASALRLYPKALGVSCASPAAVEASAWGGRLEFLEFLGLVSAFSSSGCGDGVEHPQPVVCFTLSAHLGFAHECPASDTCCLTLGSTSEDPPMSVDSACTASGPRAKVCLSPELCPVEEAVTRLSLKAPRVRVRVLTCESQTVMGVLLLNSTVSA